MLDDFSKDIVNHHVGETSVSGAPFIHVASAFFLKPIFVSLISCFHVNELLWLMCGCLTVLDLRQVLEDFALCGVVDTTGMHVSHKPSSQSKENRCTSIPERCEKSKMCPH